AVPAWVRDKWFDDKPDFILVQHDNDPIQIWNLLWYDNQKRCLIGKGWYAFCKEKLLAEGDEVLFFEKNMSNVILVMVDRQAAGF
ncbi:DNA-binding barrel domain superfamily, partial [Sesbania bispinosa]